jgi:hypothetical protein
VAIHQILTNQKCSHVSDIDRYFDTPWFSLD